MPKVPLTDIQGAYASTTELNENFDKIETAFDNTLSRDGNTPNQMEAVLDMNSNRIVNLPDPVDDTDAVPKSYGDVNYGGAAAILAVSAQQAAETAQTAAETAQTAAETAQVEAETVYGNFDGRYLGGNTSDPTLDNEGQALIEGALYWNTTTNEMRVYNGAAWEASYLPASGYAPISHTHLKANITDFNEGDYAAAAHNHVKANITDFNEGDYATAAHTHLKANITDFSESAYVHTTGTETIAGNKTFSGTTNFADNVVTRPKLDDYSIQHATTTFTATPTFDYSANQSHVITLTGNITSITLSNPPASGSYGEMVIEFIQDATGSRTVSGWPASVKWAGGSAPTITAAANSIDKVFLSTRNGGSTWLGDFSQGYA